MTTIHARLGLVALCALAIGMAPLDRLLPRVQAGPLAAPVGTAFTYQGQLKQGGQPVSGTCDVQFSLFDAAGGGAPVGSSPQTATNVAVSNGLFTVTLDFGANAFTGTATWLELAPRCPAGNGSFATLTPRQPVTPAPNAIFAERATAFSGALAGDVTGGQGTTTVASIGGKTASAVATTVNTVGAATSTDSPATLALRDGSGNLSLQTLTLDSNLNLPATSATNGVVFLGGSRFLHSFGPNSTFLGSLAGNLSLTGTDNTGVGAGAAQAVTSGQSNTAVGVSALNANTTGSQNVAVGGGALQGASGSHNTAVGYAALSGANNTGTNNTAVGYAALEASTNGFENTAVGQYALFSSTSGADNTAIGPYAVGNVATGSRNMGISPYALAGLTSGSDNIALGYNAGFFYNGAEGLNIIIGNDNFGVQGESRTTRIGQTFVQTRAFIAGIYGATPAGGSTLPVVVDANGQLGTTSSSARFKDNVADMGDSSSVLRDLRPVTFVYKPELGGDPDQPQVGLIAEEVAQVAPWMVVHDAEGQPAAVHYEMLAPMLLNELQAQQRTIEQQASDQAAKDTEIGRLRADLTALAARLAALEQVAGQ